ncbi:MAG: hypothetical protein V5B35_01685 [Candidatus Accumulibacter necessarius]|jgi:hypothetical protein
MTTALENRLKRLEKAMIPPGDSIDLICIRLVSPGGKGEIIRADLGDGILERLERRADEAEDTFIERAKVAALAASAQRPRRIILHQNR